MDRYKRFILKKSKNYRPYTLDGIGNFYFSPGMGWDDFACFVDPTGYVYGISYYVTNSYGHLVRSVLQILIKLVVKIAGHERRLRVASYPFWLCRLRQIQRRPQFLRAYSPGTDWDDIACYLGPNGNIFENINFYIDSVKDSYGHLTR